jgi:Skp family chaperone for outer membrane proteins
MRIIVLGLVVLMAATGVANADDAKLREEIGILRAEKQVLEERVRKLSAELEKAQRVESELTRLRTELARGFQDMNDRLARLEGGAVGPRVAVRPDTRTEDPVITPRTDPTRAPLTTPSITPAKPTVGPDSNPKITTPSIVTPLPNPTRPADPPSLTRNDLPRIPDPVTPGTPIRVRPKTDRPKGTPTTVAMVDMVHLWTSLKEKQAIEEGLSDLVYAVQFTDQTWQKKIRDYELDFSLLAQGSEAYLEKKRLIEAAYIERNVAMRAAQSKLNRRRGELTKLLYAKMVDSIGRVADENGYDAVIFKEPEPNFNSLKSINDLFNDRMVVQGIESVDLSEQVIAMMNRDFDRQLSSGNK